MRIVILTAVILNIALPLLAEDRHAVQIGSKKFTESVILGEVISHLLEEEGYQTEHHQQLGGTRILWNALLKGEIDAYPDYSGTLIYEILRQEDPMDMTGLRDTIEQMGIRMTDPLGFNNTYALGMRSEQARTGEYECISDLREHPELRFGFTNEFMDRGDGWPNLQKHYRLPQRSVRGLDHDLAYRGLEAGSIDVIDLYSTDAEISYYDIHILEDDLHYFPEYHAVFLFRESLLDQYPDLESILNRFAGDISEDQMIRMNAGVKLEGRSENSVAAEFVAAQLGTEIGTVDKSGWDRFLVHTREHLTLVSISLLAAIIIAIPLGMLAVRHPGPGQIILGVVGIIQTIPSLALLVFMIPLLGIGGPPAVVALFLYSLLPIVRNTYAGLHDIPAEIHESAIALGLPAGARLRLVELPLALRSILAV